MADGLLIPRRIGEVAFNLPSAATAGEEKVRLNETACLREPVFCRRFTHSSFLLAVAAEGFFLKDSLAISPRDLR